MEEENNDFIKRTAGKLNGDIKRIYFRNFYLQHTKQKKLNVPEYNAVLTDLLSTFSEKIVTENLELNLGLLGKLRVRSRKLNFFRSSGERAKTLQVNWEATLKYWKEKYPGLNAKELKQIKNKTVIFYENNHSNGEYYEHYWDNITCKVPFAKLYKFKPVRQYSRLIAKVVKDPNRKTFYYE